MLPECLFKKLPGLQLQIVTTSCQKYLVLLAGKCLNVSLKVSSGFGAYKCRNVASSGRLSLGGRSPGLDRRRRCPLLLLTEMYGPISFVIKSVIKSKHNVNILFWQVG